MGCKGDYTIRYIDKSYQEAALIDPPIAILPLGSFEQHGPHLPLGTDIYIVEALAEGIAERLGAFLLPAQPITTCYEHHGKIGSVHFSADVFYKFIVNIVENMHRKGFNRIVILQGHGGIFILEPAIRYLNATYPALAAIIVGAEAPPGPDNPLEPGGIHADDMETSLMLHLHPELVKMASAVDFIPEKPRPYLNYGSIFTLSPSGVWGNATKATAEKGKWMYDNAVGEAVRKIEALFAALA